MAIDQASGSEGNRDNHHGVRFLSGAGGLPLLKIDTEWSSAEIYLQGAHVTHFQAKDQAPLLFLSRSSRFEEGQAIRGGIPIILPWFGSRSGMPAHGCARNRPWELREIAPANDGSIALRFILDCPSVPGFAPFVAEYCVHIGVALNLELSVTNRSSDQELSFEDCLHSYFSVGDVAAVSVVGLKGIRFIDKVAAFAEKVENADALKISSEVDSVYQNTTGTIEILDPVLRRKILVEKQNSASTVVWNPWMAKAQQMADFGTDEFRKMICVESGNVGTNKVTLAPGKTAVMKVRLSSVSL